MYAPRCFSEMRVISTIKEPDVIKKILKHLDLWDVSASPGPLPAPRPAIYSPHMTNSRDPVLMIT